MGKRKERRLAALGNAGRRIKLDLFAEPSGDLGGSSVNNGVGGDIDPSQHAELPNSPSSSGQQPQNPLLLLGQYSDDDLDEESSKRSDSSISENSPADHNDQEEPIDEGKDGNTNALEDLTVQKVDQQDMRIDSMPVDVLEGLEGGDFRESDATASDDTLKEKDSLEKVSITGISNAQVIGDVSAGWRMVVHEESNQYYYWNTETGETSWEIPAVLAQHNQLTSDHKACAAEYMEAAQVGANLSTSTLAVGLDNSVAALLVEGSVGNGLITQSTEVHGNGPQMNDWVEGYRNEYVKGKNWDAEAHQGETQSNFAAVNTALGDVSSVASEHIHDALANDHRGTNLSTSLMKQCESLLERLESLKGYGTHLQGQDQMLKYIIEVEMRLSDIKSLSTYGSPLLPFWVHCERRLKQLEDVINNEIYQLAVSAQMDGDVEATADDSFKEKEKSQENMVEVSEADANENSKKSEVSPVSTSIENDSHNKGDYGSIHSSNIPAGSPSMHLEGGAPVSEELNGTIHECLPAEDIDMDVDMEVEEGEFCPASITTVGDTLSAEDVGPNEKMVQSNPPAEHLSLSSGDALTVPPTPDEEWIPPPPPDNDQVPPPPPDSEQTPPPPPDEPPECSYPPLPSYPETGQPLPYTEQYNLTYPDLNYQYYGHTVAVPSCNFYGNTDGSQAAVPHASLYYIPAPSTYVETASVMVNSVQPVEYYNVQDGSVLVPVVSGVESSQSYIESGPVSYDTLASDQIKTDDSIAELNVKLGGSAVGVGTDLASKGVPSTLTTTEAPTMASVKETANASSTNAVTASTVAAASALLTGAKVQTKVSRKKRTVAVAPSMRSNKKVSSLVDKWNAAKEELNESEEEEPKSAYEILERKRQREIEEWRAKQIASGEAKDNANFQPLGGDWRERVKRRRAQAAKEAALTLPEAPTDENKQPDLEELSKGLPSGWQVYWDESSKKVYYGNVITSETTWTRPRK
ncbi:hypothetical protein OIU85_002285 [Salix viminalis]|uniref:WW domain-containing protein n=2 Tax=Salix viminalis TaxID=40686 RepID=A0A9Q0VNF2_SALVM|nr:hypothetical protein OIU85_002285 [Salix viminalis]